MFSFTFRCDQDTILSSVSSMADSMGYVVQLDGWMIIVQWTSSYTRYE